MCIRDRLPALSLPSTSAVHCASPLQNLKETCKQAQEIVVSRRYTHRLASVSQYVCYIHSFLKLVAKHTQHRRGLEHMGSCVAGQTGQTCTEAEIFNESVTGEKDPQAA
eukprot:1212996-Amphidinium_carterae.1